MAEIPAITIEKLTKEYRLGLRGFVVRAVDDLSLSVPTNSVFGLLGPNGSGKSTTIKAILGLIRPTRGSLQIFGSSSSSIVSRQRVGYLPERPDFYQFLTGRELIHFYGKLSGLADVRLEERTNEVLHQVNLVDAADRSLSTYSKGMLQRIGLAQAIVHDPDLVILDEPTAGVDPLGAEAMADIILALKAAGKTVLLCSHHLSQVEQLCDSVAILYKGRCLVQGPLEELLERNAAGSIRIPHWSPEVEQQALEALKAAGIPVEGVRMDRGSLEALFLEHARKGGRDR